MIVNIFDTLEEHLVEGNLVLEFGEQRHHLLLRLGNDGRLVGTRQSEEHIRDAIECYPTLLIRQDGVLEGGCLLTFYNLPDLLTLLLNSRLDGWQIVSLLDLAEVGCAKRQVARRHCLHDNRCESDSEHSLDGFHIRC